MAPTFSSLSTNNVDANIKGFFNMFWVADHVHDRDASLVKSVDNFFWRYTDSGDEELCFLLNDNVYEFRELAFSVIILSKVKSRMTGESIQASEI